MLSKDIGVQAPLVLADVISPGPLAGALGDAGIRVARTPAELQALPASHGPAAVDIISDRIVMISNGYVVAEGDIQGVRSEMDDHPMHILIRCDRPSLVAALIFQQDSVVAATLKDDGQ